MKHPKVLYWCDKMNYPIQKNECTGLNKGSDCACYNCCMPKYILADSVKKGKKK